MTVPLPKIKDQEQDQISDQSRTKNSILCFDPSLKFIKSFGEAKTTKSRNMKSLFIISLMLLSSSISALSDIDSEIETKKNQDVATPAINMSVKSHNHQARGTQEDCGLIVEVSLLIFIKVCHSLDCLSHYVFSSSYI